MAERKMVRSVGELKALIASLPDDMPIAIWRNGCLVEIGDLMGVDNLIVHQRDPSFVSTQSIAKEDKALRRMSKQMAERGEALVIG